MTSLSSCYLGLDEALPQRTADETLVRTTWCACHPVLEDAKEDKWQSDILVESMENTLPTGSACLLFKV